MASSSEVREIFGSGSDADDDGFDFDRLLRNPDHRILKFVNRTLDFSKFQNTLDSGKFQLNRMMLLWSVRLNSDTAFA